MFEPILNIGLRRGSTGSRVPKCELKSEHILKIILIYFGIIKFKIE
jgi:hypothetical protein